MNFTVEEFSWQYDYLLNRIKVLGKVKNTTGEPVQGCLMTAVAYDQFNQPLGANSVFLYPTFLDIDQESDFELNFSGGEEVVNIYIRCRFDAGFEDGQVHLIPGMSAINRWSLFFPSTLTFRQTQYRNDSEYTVENCSLTPGDTR